MFVLCPYAYLANALSLAIINFQQSLPLLASLIGIAYGIGIAAWVLRQSPGTEEMQRISQLIARGARAFLLREYKTILTVGSLLAVIIGALYFFAYRSVAYGLYAALSFALGALGSALAGYVGMYITTRSASRTAEAAKKGGLKGALLVSFRAGSVMGTMLISVGILVVSLLYLLLSGLSAWAEILIPTAFGASLISLFIRVAGGIYTKASDWGADIVGKVEKGIPEDDPRNPATIADNVGDNVGDVAGMASDVYESLVVVLTGAMFISFIFKMGSVYYSLPLVIASFSLISAIIGMQMVRGEADSVSSVMQKLSLSLYTTIALSLLFLLLFLLYEFGLSLSSLSIWLSALLGMITSAVVLKVTEYFTHYTHNPVKEIAKQAKISASNVIVTGYAYGLMSSVPIIITVSASLGLSFYLGYFVLRYPNPIAGGIFDTAIASVGLLSLAGIIITLDSFGPVSDNASGLAEMTGLSEEVRKHTDALDAVGNTTKATTKGYAIASAGLAAVVLFIGFIYEAVKWSLPGLTISENIKVAFQQVSVLNPEVLIGTFLGAVLVYLFSSRTLSSVSRSAMELVEEIRRQFRERPGILEGKESPDYERAIDIVTKHALSEFMLPGLLAVILPLAVGALLGWVALVGLILGTIIVGFPRALLMANAGGAWDNAKKYIETGADPSLGGKGSEAHKNSVVGDVVGDPFKDTTGPSLNPLIKVVNTVSVVFAPAIVFINKVLGINVSLFIALYVHQLLLLLLAQ